MKYGMMFLMALGISFNASAGTFRMVCPVTGSNHVDVARNGTMVVDFEQDGRFGRLGRLVVVSPDPAQFPNMIFGQVGQYTIRGTLLENIDSSQIREVNEATLTREGRAQIYVSGFYRQVRNAGYYSLNVSVFEGRPGVVNFVFPDLNSTTGAHENVTVTVAPCTRVTR